MPITSVYFCNCIRIVFYGWSAFIVDLKGVKSMRESQSKGDAQLKRRPPALLKGLFVFLGLLAVCLGSVGMIIPVLPTTPFYILASFLFARSSDRLTNWLKRQKPYIKHVQPLVEGKGMPVKSKISVCVIIWLMMLIMFFKVDTLALKLVAVGVGLFHTLLFIRMPNGAAARKVVKHRKDYAIPLFLSSRLFSMTKGSRLWIALTVAGKLLALGAGILFAYRLGNTFEGIINGEKSLQKLLPFITTCLVVLIVRLILSPFTAYASHQGGARARYTMRSMLFKKLMTLETHYSEDGSISRTAGSAMEGIEALESYFGAYLPQLFYALIAPLALFAALFPLSPQAAVIMLVLTPLIPLALNGVMAIARKMSRSHFAVYQNLGALFFESVLGLTTLKLFNRDQDKAAELEKKAWSFRDRTMRVLGMQLNSLVFMDILAYGGAAAGMATAAVSLARGEISVAAGVTALFLASEFFLPLRALSSYFHVAMTGTAAAENLFEFLQLPEPEPARAVREEGPEELNLRGPYGIRLDKVSFSYPGRKRVLDHVSLNVEPGRITALVGESGSGKSTVAALMVRFLEPEAGQIRLYGLSGKALRQEEIPLGEIPAALIRRKVCMVTQNTFIFSGTIEDNLRMGKPQATETELYEVLQQVGLWEPEGPLCNGLITQTGEEGKQLSGGQRQMLGMARALLRDGDIYIFDEATANVDAENEEKMGQLIEELALRGKSVLLITHHPALASRAHRRYSLKKGILEEDTGSTVHLTIEEEKLKEVL